MGSSQSWVCLLFLKLFFTDKQFNKNLTPFRFEKSCVLQYDPALSFMGLYALVFCMHLFGSFWSYRVLYGTTRLYDLAWFCMVLLCIVIYCSVWLYMVLSCTVLYSPLLSYKDLYSPVWSCVVGCIVLYIPGWSVMVSYVFVWSVMYSPAESCIVFYGLISGLLKFGLVHFFYCQLWSFMILYSYVSCMIRYDPANFALYVYMCLFRLSSLCEICSYSW